jgi:hypothetical protein
MRGYLKFLPKSLRGRTRLSGKIARGVPLFPYIYTPPPCVHLYSDYDDHLSFLWSTSQLEENSKLGGLDV